MAAGRMGRIAARRAVELEGAAASGCAKNTAAPIPHRNAVPGMSTSVRGCRGKLQAGPPPLPATSMRGGGAMDSMLKMASTRGKISSPRCWRRPRRRQLGA
jgi:hypothetical protein